MADENKKAEPVFQGIDESGMDFQYEEDINKLGGWFYRSGSPISGGGGSGGSSGGSTGGSGQVDLDPKVSEWIKGIYDKLQEGVCNCQSGSEIQIEDLVDDIDHTND